MEKAKFGARKEVLITLLSGIDINLVSWPASSPGDDEDFILFLKPFVGMAMPAEKQSSFLELKKRTGKVNPGFVLRETIPVTL